MCILALSCIISDIIMVFGHGVMNPTNISARQSENATTTQRQTTVTDMECQREQKIPLLWDMTHIFI